MMMEGVLSAGHAKVLLGIEDRELQYTLALRVMDEDLSVRQLEKVLQQMKRVTLKRLLPPQQIQFITRLRSG